MANEENRIGIGIEGVGWREFWDASTTRTPQDLAAYYHIPIKRAYPAVSRTIRRKTKAEGRSVKDVKDEHSELKVRNGVLVRSTHIGLRGVTLQQFWDVSATNTAEGLALHYGFKVDTAYATLSRVIRLKAHEENRTVEDVKHEHNQLRVHNGVMDAITGNHVARNKPCGGKGKSKAYAPARRKPVSTGTTTATGSQQASSAPPDNPDSDTETDPTTAYELFGELHTTATADPVDPLELDDNDLVESDDDEDPGDKELERQWEAQLAEDRRNGSFDEEIAGLAEELSYHKDNAQNRAEDVPTPEAYDGLWQGVRYLPHLRPKSPTMSDHDAGLWGCLSAAEESWVENHPEWDGKSRPNPHRL